MSLAGRIFVVSQLLHHDANMKAKYSSGGSPLFAAIASETTLDGLWDLSEEIINYLSERGADMGAMNEALFNLMLLPFLKATLPHHGHTLQPSAIQWDCNCTAHCHLHGF